MSSSIKSKKVSFFYTMKCDKQTKGSNWPLCRDIEPSFRFISLLSHGDQTIWL